MANSPLFRTTTAAVAKGSTASVDVRFGGSRPARYVSVTPSQAPDGGSLHQVAINEATPLLDQPTLPGAGTMTAWEHTFANSPEDAWAVQTVIVKSGADGTTFDVVAIL